MFGLKKFTLFSFLLNVLLVGIILGHMTNHFHLFSSSERGIPFKGEKREIVDRQMKKMRTEMRERRPEMRKVRKELFEILTAPDFSEVAYKTKLAELERFRSEMHKVRSQIVADLASQMTREDRVTLARYLKRRQGPGHMGGQRMKGKF